MQRRLILIAPLIALALTLLTIAPIDAKSATYRTGFTKWRAASGGFSAWSLNGVTRAADGTLQLNLAGAQSGTDSPGAYYGHNFYNGGNYKVGEATGPVVLSAFEAFEAIASWNADTPAGTWIETLIQARIGTRWTKWYNLGVWAADYSTIERHSVNLQGDNDGYVAVDTLVLNKVGANAFQLTVRLFSENSSTPTVRNMSLAYSTQLMKAGATSADNPALPNTALNVPQCSQMVYPGGGEVWCSPTSTSMVWGYWANDGSSCAQREPIAVNGVYDWLYDGHGNWPFNTAFAATKGLEGYVARLTSLAQAEPWINAGVPVVISYAWKKSSLDGAPIPRSSGHLAVLVGFDANGNPVVNDPAAATNETVRRTYNRAELEKAWLESSGGTVYLIYPPARTVPNLQ